MVGVQVTLLDDQTVSFEVDSKATGEDLLTKVADYLQVGFRLPNIFGTNSGL